MFPSWGLNLDDPSARATAAWTTALFDELFSASYEYAPDRWPKFQMRPLRE